LQKNSPLFLSSFSTVSAEDCHPPGFNEWLLTRKLALQLDESAAIADSQQTLSFAAGF
jgi:hypothetical protein